MRAATAVLVVMLSVIGSRGAEPTASPFEGVWHRTWSSTTPKGLHTEGRGTLTINTRGRSTEISDITLSLRRRNPPAPLHIVQSCYSTSISRRDSSVTIQWSALKLVSPRPQDIPPTLHLWTAPLQQTYVRRGDTLISTAKEPVVWHRAKQRE
ncbi:MAG TPA: hypothetical protein VH188_00990 [Chthoniobacterales bacterium]|nr:hypothetical protein [Chthoniobacterales bacterium]